MAAARRHRTLSGKRVELRPHSRKNYPLYSEWYGDREIWHLTSWAASPLIPSVVEQMFRERETSATDESFAVHRLGERKPIGVISLTNINKGNASADLSVILGSPEDRQQGYGVQAIELLLYHAFENIGLHRVGLSVFEFNELAIAAYDKLGFKEEGRLRQAIKRYDDRYDAILMSILKPEWESSRRP